MASRRLSRRMMFTAPLAAAAVAWVGSSAKGAEDDFNAFLDAVRREAGARGIRLSTVDSALRSAEYLPHVIELDRHQPEQVLTFAQYLQKTVSPQRIENARRQLFDNRLLLDSVRRRYYVEPRLIVALWGLESDFAAKIGAASAVETVRGQGRDD